MSDSKDTGRFLGKFRGTVVNNIDPEFRGRLTLEIPDVLGLVPSNWAECCTPLSGPTGSSMGVYMVPPIGAAVWVEFERGDPSLPIWTGCRSDVPADVPPVAHAGLPVSPNIVIQTAGQNSFIISDVPGPVGGIILKSSTGLSTIMINDTGITITGPTVTINGVVNINNGALAVTL